MRKRKIICCFTLFMTISISVFLWWFLNRGYVPAKPYSDILDFQYFINRSGIAEVEDKIYVKNRDSLYSFSGGEVSTIAESKLWGTMEDSEEEEAANHFFQYGSSLFYVHKDGLYVVGEQPVKVKTLGENIEGLLVDDNFLYFASGDEKYKVKSTISGPVRKEFKKYQYKRINLDNYVLEDITGRQYEELYDWYDKNFRYDNKNFEVYRDVSGILHCDAVDIPFIRQYQIDGDVTYVLFESVSENPNSKEIQKLFYKLDSKAGKLEENPVSLPLDIKGFIIKGSKLYVNSEEALDIYDMDNGEKKEIVLENSDLEIEDILQ